MRKFVFGLIVGVALTAASSAYADDIVQSIVGKKVEGQFPVKILGKSLDTQAVVVDGTSYLPVRSIGESLNMGVKFDSATGIELTRKGATTLPDTTVPIDKEAIKARIERNNKILELNNKIKEINKELEVLYAPVSAADMMQRQTPDYQYDDAYYTAKKAWEDKKAELVVIDKQLAELQNNFQ